MAFNTINILIPYLLIYNHGLIFSLAADGAANLTSLADKRVAAGYISIDCGSEPEAVTSGYKSDENFIDTGKNHEIAREYDVPGLNPVYRTVRSFPDGVRNCYTLKPLQGSNNKFLIRAMFMYGNYDQQNQSPVFHIYIGVTFWDVISLNDIDERIFYEIIYKPTTEFIDICLINIGQGTPFISELALRPLSSAIYSTKLGALYTDTRYQFDSFSQLLNPDYTSEPYDIYDRQWSPASQKRIYQWMRFSKGTNFETLRNDDYKVPPNLLMSAAMPKPGITNMIFYHTPTNPTDVLYFYWHFAEIEKHNTKDSREFEIFLDGNSVRKIRLEYMNALTVISPPCSVLLGNSSILFTINQTNASTLPPILNALEIFRVINISHVATNQDDVKAITDVRTKYSVITGWQGDPCLPKVPWEGLSCSDNANNDPLRITSLNLSSKGLIGEILPSLSSLTSLIYLNLSNNSLTGKIPESLAKLPSLKVLDLRGNNLNGPVPAGLTDKNNSGILSLRLEGNPDVCMSNPCKKKNSKKMVAILSSTTSITFIFISIAILICILKRKKAARYIKNASLKLESRSFTYVEVMSMTNNFQTIIGKGGSGAVYHGSLEDYTPVAVKMLNPSTLSLKLFRTEAELLTRVHHRSLVSLIGYCEEGTTMALIYEHVTNGNLQQHISDKNTKVLCWKERLQIAIDAAQGLEYMHSGCKPPIVHRDMKSSNILLDENMHAKISDFGISKSFSIESTESGLNTNVMGTHGYVDPEYYSTQRLNKKSDVFSFGVVLLELITGKSPIVRSNDGEAIHIIAWTTPKLESGDIELIVDNRLEGDFSTNSAWKALEIAMMCVSSTAIQRPTMNQVLSDLNDCFAIEMSQGRNKEMDSHDYGYPTTDIAIADTSIEMGPTAR